jgi:1-acyl-sn-glycerol-3-phosphate acyltransferase
LGIWFGKVLCRLLGWKAVGDFPTMPKAMFIASPHTSLWDGIIMVTIAWALGVRLSWITKKETLSFPFKRLVTFFGAVPVDRDKRSDTVAQIAEEFKVCKGMYLAIAPAGTRKKRDYWKSGFYHMALQADVPLICGFLDYKRKEGGIRAIIHPTGDARIDMDRVREVYAGVEGKYPPLMTRIRLRLEDAEDVPATASKRGIA